MARFAAALGALLLAATPAVHGADAAGARAIGGVAQAADPALEACRDRAARALPAAARELLPRIHGLGEQLLALRSYLRVRDLATRWSWTDAQIAAWAGSPGQRAALDAVARVQRTFAARNPGYLVYANLQVRSLEMQLGKWNDNASVRAAADALLPAARAACSAAPTGLAPWLLAWKPPVAPTLAAPGLSPHGQGRAFDFQVQTPEPVLVAGTDARRIQADWRSAGWAAKLADAVRASDAAFSGPLPSPDEPWHYAYLPAGAMPVPTPPPPPIQTAKTPASPATPAPRPPLHERNVSR